MMKQQVSGRFFIGVPFSVISVVECYRNTSFFYFLLAFATE